MGFRAIEASLIFRTIGYGDRALNQPAKYAQRVVEESAKAASLMKPDHEMYLDVQLYNGKIVEVTAAAPAATANWGATCSISAACSARLPEPHAGHPSRHRRIGRRADDWRQRWQRRLGRV